MTLAAFKGTNRVHIYDRIDVQDDLLTQFDEAMIFLQKHLNVRSEIKGINRKDIYEIPLEALREAVANAIIHRDYGIYGTSIMVEVHADRVVISNPGGIAKNADIKALVSGVSIRRNEIIADLFARMDKAERMGSGLKRIGELMEAAEQPFPEIEILSDLFFKISFKRPFYTEGSEIGSEVGSEIGSEIGSEVGSEVGSEIGSEDTLAINAEKILATIQKDPHISAKKLAAVIGISTRNIERHITNLKIIGKLERVGNPKSGYWKVK